MTNLAPLLAAMIAVESSGNPAAIGDGGRARGVLQIHPGVVQDVNRVYGTTYRHQDMHNPAVAVDVAKAYLAHYCPNAGPERMARVWHCGPSGWRRKAGEAYWNKVKGKMR